MSKRYYDEVQEFIKSRVEAYGIEEFLYEHDLEPWEAMLLLYDHGLLDVDPEEMEEEEPY